MSAAVAFRQARERALICLWSGVGVSPSFHFTSIHILIHACLVCLFALYFFLISPLDAVAPSTGAQDCSSSRWRTCGAETRPHCSERSYQVASTPSSSKWRRTVGDRQDLISPATVECSQWPHFRLLTFRWCRAGIQNKCDLQFGSLSDLTTTVSCLKHPYGRSLREFCLNPQILTIRI